jgi:NAD(P)-dependent dehydrogenase (short-subunit alcohol dehydrogenase family)
VNRLENKRAIVTGGAAGIGWAIARRFAEEGARVMVADLDGDAAPEAAGALGEAHLSCQTDISEEKEVAEAIWYAVREMGGLDVMVNNAGVGVAASTTDTTVEDFDRVVSVNLKGAFLGMKHAIPAIRDSGGGSVINMSSIAALVGLVDRAAYSAAKGGILSLTRAAAIDHISEGVRVNCIVPGTVDTPWVERITSGYDDPEKARAAMKARQPHGRLVSPEEVAAMAAYLASDEAASAVGAAMVVDGGVTAR